MKRILNALLLVLILSFSLVTALADELPDYSEMSDIELQARGIVLIRDGMTLNDFYQAMRAVDETKDFFNTDKFMYFLFAIEELYYIPTTAEEMFQRFAENFRYVDTKDMDTVYKNLFSLLDKYSYYIPAELYESFWNPTTSKGVGLTFVYDSTGTAWGGVGTFVEGVSAGSTAEVMDIRVGDRLISINNIDVSNAPFTSVQAVLSSLTDEDAYIELVVERIEGDTVYTIDTTLERRPTVFREYTFHLYPEERAFVLELMSFRNESTPGEILERMRELRREGYVNAILDLRGNPGGDVYIASGIIGDFLQEERFVFSMGRDGRKNYESFRTGGKGVRFDQLYVLVDETTASSAEITALCLKQHANATLVGTRTVGKAVAQSASRIIDNSTYGITTFVAYDYRGETYNGKGLTPTLYVENGEEQFDFPTDLEWFNHINYVEACEGAENTVVTALERRLEIMGYLRADFVDGRWDENTTNAVKYLQIAQGYEVTGKLDIQLVVAITHIINAYKNYHYIVDNQLAVIFERTF